MERLTAKRAETLRKPGRDQAGQAGVPGCGQSRTARVNKRWVQRLHVQGKRRRDITIGTYAAITLSEIQERAHDNRLTAKRGGDPSGRELTVPTFTACPPGRPGGQWRGRTRETRRRTLARYAARLMSRPVDQIDRAAVLLVLGPVYRDKPSTGKL